jgi:hypothetical protein
MDLNEYQFKVFGVHDLQRKLKALSNPSLNKIIHCLLNVLLISAILVTAHVTGMCKYKGKKCVTRPNTGEDSRS